MTAELTEEDLERVTGLTQHASQVRWLEQHGLTPMVRRSDGLPIVTWAALTMAMTGHLGGNAGRKEPDFSALGKAS